MVVSNADATCADDAVWYSPTVTQSSFYMAMSPNDEVERRGASPASSEGILSQSSIRSLAQRRCDPRSLEPLVRLTHEMFRGEFQARYQ
jgi:hypothetical protein